MFLKCIYHVQKINMFLCKFGLFLAGIIFTYMIGNILIEILIRNFFQSSTHIVYDAIGYGVVSITFLSLGYSLEHGSLVKINFLDEKLPYNISSVLQGFLAIISFLVVSFISYYVFLDLYDKYVNKTISMGIYNFPLWLPMLFIFIGILIFNFQLFAMSLRLFFTKEKNIFNVINEEQKWTV